MRETVSLRNKKDKIMKITANKIEAGMTVKVAGIRDNKENYQSFSVSENFSEEKRKKYALLIDNDLTKVVGCGTVKKSSPTVEIYKVTPAYSETSESSYSNRKVTTNTLYIHTDQGILTIGARQKVLLIDDEQ